MDEKLVLLLKVTGHLRTINQILRNLATEQKRFSGSQLVLMAIKAE